MRLLANLLLIPISLILFNHAYAQKRYITISKPDMSHLSRNQNNNEEFKTIIDCLNNQKKQSELNAWKQSAMVVAQFEIDNHEQAAVELGVLKHMIGENINNPEYSYINDIEKKIQQEIHKMDERKVNQWNDIASQEKSSAEKKIANRLNSIRREKELKVYELVKSSNTSADWNLYLTNFPDGKFRNEFNAKQDLIANPNKYMSDAIKRNDLPLVKELLLNGANTNSFNERKKEGKKEFNKENYWIDVSTNQSKTWKSYKKVNTKHYTNWLHEAIKNYLEDDRISINDTQIIEQLLNREASVRSVVEVEEVYTTDFNGGWSEYPKEKYTRVFELNEFESNWEITKKEIKLYALIMKKENISQNNYIRDADLNLYSDILFLLSENFEDEYLDVIKKILDANIGIRRNRWNNKNYKNYFSFVKKQDLDSKITKLVAVYSH